MIGECDAEKIIHKIDSYLKDFNAHSGLPYTVQTSSGTYTTSLNDGFDILKAIRFADKKMYEIKNDKKLGRSELD